MDNDLVIFPIFKSDLSSSVLAAATYCLYKSRPLMGVLLLNPKLSFTKNNTDNYIKHVLLHEITHVLVFHPQLFKNLGLTKVVNDVTYEIEPPLFCKKRKSYSNSS